jgi:hypothetical protein
VIKTPIIFVRRIGKNERNTYLDKEGHGVNRLLALVYLQVGALEADTVLQADKGEIIFS